MKITIKNANGDAEIWIKTRDYAVIHERKLARALGTVARYASKTFCQLRLT